MELVFATTSDKKFLHMQRDLLPHGIALRHIKMDLPEPRSYDLKEIARSKVLFAYDQLGIPCIAHDSGFYIPSIGGFPRTFVNFAMETIGLEGILRLVDGKDRACEFQDCLAYCDGAEPVFFESNAKGTLSMEPRGTFTEEMPIPLWLIFVPKGYDKTLAEFTKAEYRKYREEGKNHGYKNKFIEWIKMNP